MLLTHYLLPDEPAKTQPCIGAMPTCHDSISMSEFITNLNGQIYSNTTDVLLQTHDLPYYTISLLCMHACLPSLMHIMHYQRICYEIVLFPTQQQRCCIDANGNICWRTAVCIYMVAVSRYIRILESSIGPQLVFFKL